MKKWLIHCHIPHHTTNNNTEVHGGGGLMMMIIDVSETEAMAGQTNVRPKTAAAY